MARTNICTALPQYQPIQSRSNRDFQSLSPTFVQLAKTAGGLGEEIRECFWPQAISFSSSCLTAFAVQCHLVSAANRRGNHSLFNFAKEEQEHRTAELAGLPLATGSSDLHVQDRGTLAAEGCWDEVLGPAVRADAAQPRVAGVCQQLPEALIGSRSVHPSRRRPKQMPEPPHSFLGLDSSGVAATSFVVASTATTTACPGANQGPGGGGDPRGPSYVSPGACPDNVKKTKRKTSGTLSVKLRASADNS